MAGSRPSPAILGALLLHAGVAALFFVQWPEAEEDIIPIVSSVPVTIVSSTVIEAAAPDNPSEEPVLEDAATAPVEAPPEPAPPEPTPPPPPAPAPPRPTPPRPTPPAPAPRPAPTPRPTPPRPTPTPPRPTPPAPTPPRPTPPRPTPATPTPRPATPPARSEPSLDLDSLAGPRRPAPTTGPRAPTGQQGAGRASQATGPQIAAIFRQVEPSWPTEVCEDPDMRVTLDVTLSVDGRVVSGPTLVSPRANGSYRIAAEGVLRAFRQVGTFDVPAGFAGGRFRPSFITQTVCRNR